MFELRVNAGIDYPLSALGMQFGESPVGHRPPFLTSQDSHLQEGLDMATWGLRSVPHRAQLRAKAEAVKEGLAGP